MGKYEVMKTDVSHWPLMKTAKPWNSRMMHEKMKAK